MFQVELFTGHVKSFGFWVVSGLAYFGSSRVSCDFRSGQVRVSGSSQVHVGFSWVQVRVSLHKILVSGPSSGFDS